MDNDAFKDLVRSKVKGNKEIARETVEAAFRKKSKKRKRGKRGSGDLSSSSSESESETDRKRRNRKDAISLDQDLQPTAVRRKQGAEKPQERYRDRAKERREGTKVADNLAVDQSDEDISKYLGGDEEHTHLVKGLDAALARSVRRQMQPEQGAPSDEAEQVSVYQVQPAKTKEEAWKLLQELEDVDMTNPACQGMLHYLLKKVPGRTTATSKCVQRSHLTFSTVGVPQDLATSWELPSEQNLATGSLEEVSIPKACPLPRDLITKIQKVQSKKLSLTALQPTVKKTANKSEPQPQLPNALGSEDSDEEGESDGGESDDDIFGNVGEYTPPSKTPSA